MISDEHLLLKEAAGGDASALEALMSRYGSRVYRLAGRADARPEGPILLAGAIDARDESGRTVATSFRSSAPELVVHDPDLSGGPCPITGSP